MGRLIGLEMADYVGGREGGREAGAQLRCASRLRQLARLRQDLTKRVVAQL